MKFSARLRDLRTENRLTQDQLSMKTGLSHGCIAMLEVEKRAPTGQTLETLADFFGVSVDYLLGRTDELENIVIKYDNPADELTTDERELLANFRKLNLLNKMHVSAYAKIRLEEQADSKGNRIG